MAKGGVCMFKRNNTGIWAAVIVIALAGFIIAGNMTGEQEAKTSDSEITRVLQRVEALEQEVEALSAVVTELALASQAEVTEESTEAEATETAAPANRYATVMADYLNVRSAPSEEASRIGVLKQNAEVQVLATEGEWAKVNFKDILVGWVSMEFLKQQGE